MNTRYIQWWDRHEKLEIFLMVSVLTIAGLVWIYNLYQITKDKKHK